MVSSHCEGGTFSLAIDHIEKMKTQFGKKKTLQKESTFDWFIQRTKDRFIVVHGHVYGMHCVKSGEKNDLKWLKHYCLTHSRWRHAKISSLQWLSSPDCLGHFAEKRSLHSSPVKARRNSRQLGRIANDNFVFLQRHAHTASSVGLTSLADPSVLGWHFQNCFPPQSSFLTGRHEVVSAWVCKTVEVPRTRIVGQVGGHGTTCMSKG